jgi:hypothetical protein
MSISQVRISRWDADTGRTLVSADMPSWEDVVALGRRLREVEESTWFRTPALRVRGKSFCRLRSNPDALVIRVVDLADAHALLTASPDVYFTTPHYDGYPYVLVRLGAIDRAELAELIEDAWRVTAPKRLVAAFDA